LVHQLRHLLQMTTLNAEPGKSGVLRGADHAAPGGSLRRRQPTATQSRIFLLVAIFRPWTATAEDLSQNRSNWGDVANVLRPVFGESGTRPPLPRWWRTAGRNHDSWRLRGFKGLRDMLQTNFIEQGPPGERGTAGGMFYDPSGRCWRSSGSIS